MSGCDNDDKDTSRREFIKTVLDAGAKTFTFGSLICITAKLRLPEAGASDGVVQKELQMPAIYGFLVDTMKCIGCGSCVRADKAENDVPEQYFRTWVEQYTFYENGEVVVNSPKGASEGFAEKGRAFQPKGDEKPVKGFFVPKLCNHCINTPCIQVCPVGASYKTPEGVVLVDKKTCVGCGYCVQACPFGSRYIHPVTNVADKCTWCYHRISKGLKPACVLACPVGARTFGNVNDANSEISKALRENRVQVLKSYMGTNPRTRYIGLDSEVI